MKTLDTILDENENVYIWEDPENTIDYCIFNPTATFPVHLAKFKCLLCDSSVITGNENILSSITDTIKGAHIKCNICNQSYFVHFHVKPKKLNL